MVGKFVAFITSKAFFFIVLWLVAPTYNVDVVLPVGGVLNRQDAAVALVGRAVVGGVAVVFVERPVELEAYERDGLTGLRPLKTRTPGRSALDLQGPEPGSLLVEIEKRLSDPENCPKDWKQLWRDLRRDFGLDMSFPRLL